MNPANLTPPTDNLYKFVAISGLLIMLFSIIFPYTQYQSLRRQVDQNYIESEVLWSDVTIERKHEQQFTKSFDEEEKKLTADKKKLTADKILIRKVRERIKPLPPRRELLRLDAELKSAESEIYRSQVELLHKGELLVKNHEAMDRKVASAAAKEKNLQDLFNEQKRLVWFALSLFFFGMLVTYQGFRYWYFRVQKYQDEQISYENRKADLDIQKAGLDIQRAKLDIQKAEYEVSQLGKPIVGNDLVGTQPITNDGTVVEAAKA